MQSTLFQHPDPAQNPEFYENVTLKRGLAWVIDSILIALISVILLPFTFFTGIFFFPVMMMVIGFFYRWFTLTGQGSTWGMRLMAIELKDKDGQNLSSQTAMVHTFGYSISVVFAPLQFISIAMMFLSSRGQGLTDHLLGTVAINRPA
jgi:uncharacterized RDD family membrane protein YckC